MYCALGPDVQHFDVVPLPGKDAAIKVSTHFGRHAFKVKHFVLVIGATCSVSHSHRVQDGQGHADSIERQRPCKLSHTNTGTGAHLTTAILLACIKWAPAQAFSCPADAAAACEIAAARSSSRGPHALGNANNLMPTHGILFIVNSL